MSFGYGWQPYVSVAERRKLAERELARLRRKGRGSAPVVLQGAKLATTFWGKAWNDNLEAYSDYASRLPRGRSYVRSGSVIDLQVNGGEVDALVMGSQLYQVRVTVAPLSKARWKSICKDCSGSIDSLVELLQGRVSQAVMERVSQQQTGLFPAPREIELSCSCPDWASMCKHVAAVLYGIGARLDAQPALAFRLRSVDEGELIASAAAPRATATTAPGSARLLDGGDLSVLFGLEMEGTKPQAGVKTGTRGRKRPPAGEKPTGPSPAPARPSARKPASKRVASAAPVKKADASKGRAAQPGMRKGQPKR